VNAFSTSASGKAPTRDAKNVRLAVKKSTPKTGNFRLTLRMSIGYDPIVDTTILALSPSKSAF
jgi:hypothetical protein